MPRRGAGPGQRFSVEVQEHTATAGRLSDLWSDDLTHTLVRVDFTAVVAYLLSFLAVVLGFDSVCGEREQGTLRLLLVGSVSRGQIAAAKLLGGFISLWVPLAVAFVASLLVLKANPDVVLSGDDWVRLGLLFLLSCLFLAQVYTLCALVSTYVHGSGTSLVVCLFSWLLLGVGFANMLPTASRYLVDWPPWEEFREQWSAEWQAHGQALETWEERHPSPGEAYLAGYETDGVLRYAHPRGYTWLEQRAEHEFNLLLELADRVWVHRWQNQKPLTVQQLLVDEWSILSPFTNYQALSKWLARSMLEDRRYLGAYGLRYRQAYIDFLRHRFADRGWRRWFTDDPPDTRPMIDAPASVTPEMLASGSQFMVEHLARARERYEQDRHDPRRELDLSGLPKLGPGWKRNLGQSLSPMLPGLLVMILTTGLGALLMVWRFQRYEAG